MWIELNWIKTRLIPYPVTESLLMTWPLLPVRLWGTLQSYFDQDLMFKSHIKQLWRASFFHPYNNSNIKSIPSKSSLKKMIQAFVNCRAALAGPETSDWYCQQGSQLSCAGLSTLVTCSIYNEWQILLLTCKSLNCLAPCYLRDRFVLYQPRTLCSQSAGLLTLPREFKSRARGRTFRFQAAFLNLPVLAFLCHLPSVELTVIYIILKYFLTDIMNMKCISLHTAIQEDSKLMYQSQTWQKSWR